MLTLNTLIEIGVQPTQARLFLEPLQRHMASHQINTPNRIAGFIGQVFIESAGFTALEENLTYSSAARLLTVFPSRIKSLAQAQTLVRNPKGLANVVYASRLGNGPEASGDGWRFRGRGLKQLTGRTNYANASRDTGLGYIANPDLVSTPDHAVLTACVYWAQAKCSQYADAQDWDGLTRAVNGPGMLQKAERATKARQTLRAIARSV